MNKTGMALASSAALAVALTAGALWGSGQIQTVEQKAAEALPPSPSVLTTTVTEGKLSESIALLCKSGYKEIKPVNVAGVEGKSVLTSTPLAEGHVIVEGELLATVNGNPIVAVFGQFPLYRDLKKDDKGPDALLMNQFLIRTGFLFGEAEDIFSSESIRAARLLLDSLGFPQLDKDDWQLPYIYFSTLSGEGTIIGPAAEPGVLEGTKVFSVGLGRKGLLCVGGDGALPSVVTEGSVVQIPTLGDIAETAEVVPNLDSKTLAQGKVPSDSGLPELASEESSAAFVSLPEGVSIPGPRVEGIVTLGGTPEVAKIVPNSAIWTRNGETVVTRVAADGRQEDVPVLISFSANGLNAISTTDATRGLSVGDTVLIGGK